MSWFKPAWFKATFVEDDGSLSMAEVHTMVIALVVDYRAVLDCLDRSHPFPYLTVCSSVGTLIVAYGLAKLIRSGKWKPSVGDTPTPPTLP
jgi:hypothetical protein